MATTPVYVRAPAGQAGLVLKLARMPAVGTPGLDPAVENGAGDTLTELTNMGGWYKADVTEALDGLYIAAVELSGTSIISFFLRMEDTSNPIFEAADMQLMRNRTEPGQIAPPTTCETPLKIDFIYKYMINKAEQDGTSFRLLNYAETSVDQKRLVSDTGVGGFTAREKLISGP